MQLQQEQQVQQQLQQKPAKQRGIVGTLADTYGPVGLLRGAIRDGMEVINVLYGLLSTAQQRPAPACALQLACRTPSASAKLNALLLQDHLPGMQQKSMPEQLGLARTMMRDVVRADMVELHRLGEQAEQLRSWLSGGPQPAMGYPA